jgi:hypothetical protein
MTDERFDVLHALALTHVAAPDAVAHVTGGAPDAAAGALAAAVAEGDVQAAGDAFALTPAGRARLDEAYPARFAAARASADLGARVDTFEGHNTALLALLTDWQTVTVAGRAVPNDHADEAYDNRILDRLDDLHEQAAPLLLSMAELCWMERFVARLEAALERAGIGEHEYVSGMTVDSYHSVWHEMHESMLRGMGRSRDA